MVITFKKPRSMLCLLSNHALKLLSLKCYKMDKKSIVNDLNQAAVISSFAVGYSMLGMKIFKMTLLSIQRFDLEDMGKLVAIVTTSEMMKEYLIKQKILLGYINI